MGIQRILPRRDGDNADSLFPIFAALDDISDDLPLCVGSPRALLPQGGVQRHNGRR